MGRCDLGSRTDLNKFEERKREGMLEHKHLFPTPDMHIAVIVYQMYFARGGCQRKCPEHKDIPWKKKKHSHLRG